MRVLTEVEAEVLRIAYPKPATARRLVTDVENAALLGLVPLGLVRVVGQSGFGYGLAFERTPRGLRALRIHAAMKAAT